MTAAVKKDFSANCTADTHNVPCTIIKASA